MVETITQIKLAAGVIAEHPASTSTTLADTAQMSDRSGEPLFQRPKRVELSEEEVLKRMEAFPSRKDKFVAAIREGKK